MDGNNIYNGLTTDMKLKANAIISSSNYHNKNTILHHTMEDIVKSNVRYKW